MFQKAALLHVTGPEILKTYNTLTFAKRKNDVELLLKKFDEHFLPQKNVDYERHLFFTREDETLEKYMTDLTNVADATRIVQRKPHQDQHMPPHQKRTNSLVEREEDPHLQKTAAMIPEST